MTIIVELNIENLGDNFATTCLLSVYHHLTALGFLHSPYIKGFAFFDLQNRSIIIREGHPMCLVIFSHITYRLASHEKDFFGNLTDDAHALRLVTLLLDAAVVVLWLNV